MAASSPQNALQPSHRGRSSNKTSAHLHPAMQHLFDAIDSATEARVRDLLRRVCQERQDAAVYIAERLLLRRGALKRAAPWETDGTREEDDYESWDSEDEDEDEEAGRKHSEDDGEEKKDEKEKGESGKQRQPDVGAIHDSDYSDEEDEQVLRSEEREPVFSRQRFEVCGQCGREYDVLQNGKKSCRWHSGKSEVRWDGGWWADHEEEIHGTIDCKASRLEYPEGFGWTCCGKQHDGRGCKMAPHRPDRAKRIRRT